ncbi:MAG: A/G-specific adenine glycosylase [Betaproteobacteria bacterium]|nr:A/G-specific adenine glycosylase [Betaproteobacteria bacterium]
MIHFSKLVITWQKQHGRHHLPWQRQRDPYRVWLSEIMLQQTQVSTVLTYFERFLTRFPTINKLAEADLEQVLELWAGLGYYTRARNLHKAAQQIVNLHQGVFPKEQELRVLLPGIGRSTAGAIGVFSYNQRLPILDGNVKRVLTRCFTIPGNVYAKETENKLWDLAQSLLPKQDIVAYTQGLMDLGATVCTRSKPICVSCPLTDICQAKKNNQIASFPERKKKTPPQTLPLQVFVFEHQDRFFIIKRKKNIWRDLWAFPMVEYPIDTMNWLKANEITGKLKAVHPVIYHQLTHRTLELNVAQYHVTNNQLAPLFNEGVWLTVDEILLKAIPVAMKKILDNLI